MFGYTENEHYVQEQYKYHEWNENWQAHTV